jgi:hypothetical protein
VEQAQVKRPVCERLDIPVRSNRCTKKAWAGYDSGNRWEDRLPSQSLEFLLPGKEFNYIKHDMNYI